VYVQEIFAVNAAVVEKMWITVDNRMKMIMFALFQKRQISDRSFKLFVIYKKED